MVKTIIGVKAATNNSHTKMSRILVLLGLTIICTVLAQDAPQGESGLKIDILEPPPADCPRKVKKHDLLVLHYVGFFENGTKFDSSYERVGAVPFQFQLGIGAVIKGWEEGLLGMCVKEKRKLSVPSYLAYGDKGSGEVIPPNANLVFEVELIQVHDGPAPPNVFKMIDIDNDNFLTRDELIMYLSHQAAQQGIPVDLASQQQTKVLHDLFANEDKDKDGKISHEEFTGPKHDEL